MGSLTKLPSWYRCLCETKSETSMFNQYLPTLVKTLPSMTKSNIPIGSFQVMIVTFSQSDPLNMIDV